MKLSNEDKLSASIAMQQGDNFTRGDVLMFPLLPGEYCVQKMAGPVSGENRVITTSWVDAIYAFERFWTE